MIIEGFEDIIYLESFSLRKSIYEHSQCTFRAVIKCEDVDTFYKKIELPVSISTSDKNILFIGYVDKISIESRINKAYINVVIKSNSNRLDIEPKHRIFQNPKKTFKDIISVVKNDFFINILDEKVVDKVIEYPIIQYGETDFQFIVRMAKRNNSYVYINDKSQNQLTICKYVSNSNKVIKLSECRNYSKSKVFDYETKKYQSILIVETDILENIGNTINVKLNTTQEKYLITSWELFKVGELYYYRYTLYKQDEYPNYSIDSFPAMTSFQAKVCNNKDNENLGRIQVEFLDEPFEDISNEKLWIPFRSPYSAKNGGIVFVPDIDDIVEVIFFNDSFIAKDSVRVQPLDEQFKNIENKYIANIYDKKISLTDKELEIKSNDNTIVLSEDVISLSVGDSKVNMTKDEIKISINDSAIIINSNAITVSLKDNAIQIDDNIKVCSKGSISNQSNGKFELKGNGITVEGNDKVSIKANNINLE